MLIHQFFPVIIRELLSIGSAVISLRGNFWRCKGSENAKIFMSKGWIASFAQKRLFLRKMLFSWILNELFCIYTDDMWDGCFYVNNTK